ncbi:MAG: aspartate ammonia-lyase, partial [Acidimicrobiia bacterium]|nr:aspartate ammonia-lyase [Acidimicrobiia bacterium]
NPVIAEMTMQVAAQVMGNDTAVAWAAANGNFELNVMMPVLAHNLVESAELLASAATVLRQKAVEGIEADAERTQELLERNIIVVTALAPKIGYDLAAKVAKEAFASGRSVREVALEMEVLPADELDASLDLRGMTEGGIVG